MGELVAGKWEGNILSKTEFEKHQGEMILDSESAKGEILKVRLWILGCVENYGRWEPKKRASGRRRRH